MFVSPLKSFLWNIWLACSRRKLDSDAAGLILLFVTECDQSTFTLHFLGAQSQQTFPLATTTEVFFSNSFWLAFCNIETDLVWVCPWLSPLTRVWVLCQGQCVNAQCSLVQPLTRVCVSCFLCQGQCPDSTVFPGASPDQTICSCLPH